MQEIKFRAKRRDNQKWEYGYYFHDEFNLIDSDYIIQTQEDDEELLMHTIIPFTLGQYINSNERTPIITHGRKIFIGDVIRLSGGEEWCGSWQYDKRMIVKDFSDCFEIDESEYVEIMGNIYDNPKLLERE